MPRPLLVFDMDGVLLDVTESYRESIVRTVEYFTGKRIPRELIQDYKNRGGWNNDWALSRKIAADLGVEVDYQTVVVQFQKYFFGENGEEGLILQEKWVPEVGLLQRLAQRFQLAIFTGRLREEAAISLRRFASDIRFDPLVGHDDVANTKPHPEGLQKIVSEHPGASVRYIGDTVDDARAARAAGVPFIGVVEPSNPRAGELRGLIEAEGAQAVIENVNQIEGVLPE